MLNPRTLALRVFTELPFRRTPQHDREKTSDLPNFPVVDGFSKNVLIAPANSAGQAKLWAIAASKVPGWTGFNMTYQRGSGFAHPTDSSGQESAVVYSPKWARQLRALIVEGFSAVIYESLLPLLGSVHFQDAAREIRYFQRTGIKTAVLWHGSDIRDPFLHRSNTAGSVFFDAPADTVLSLSKIVKRNARIVDRLGVPTFVSTPDLLRYQPRAKWLPLVVPPAFIGVGSTLRDSERPLVLHLPSQGYLKGTATIATEMRQLDDEGVIRYIQPGRVPHSEVRALLEAADIVIDQIGMDAYGVATIEAMSLGKTVVGQVGAFVRDVVRTKTGQEVPVQEATAETIRAVVRELAADFSKRKQLAAVGREYVEKVHSLRNATQALTPFLEG